MFEYFHSRYFTKKGFLASGDARYNEFQGHFMGMNPMHSGSLPTSGAPPPGGFPNGLPNMQAPSNASGPQMYPQGGTYNRPQAGQMSMMPGYNPYQVW
jgi:polyadenylation factor subunit 2